MWQDICEKWNGEYEATSEEISSREAETDFPGTNKIGSHESVCKTCEGVLICCGYKCHQMSNSPFDLQFDNGKSQDLLLKLVVNNNHPFTLVEEEPFMEFVDSFDRPFKHITAKTMINRVMDTYYKGKIKIKMMFEDDEVGGISTSTDGWAAGNHLAMIAVTATWYTQTFELIDIVLSFREVGVSHTGENICKSFVEVLREFGIENKVSCSSRLPLMVFTNKILMFL